MMFEELLEKWMSVKRGSIAASTFTTHEREVFWDYVQNYIVGISKKLFRQHNFKNREDERELTPHDYRVDAFYMWVEYFAMPRNKSARWILKVFKLRLVDIEGLLSLKRSGYVHVDDIIKSGATMARLAKIRVLAGARRRCRSNDFKEIVAHMPSKVKRPMPLWLHNKWYREFKRMQWLEMYSLPLPLREDLFNDDEGGLMS